MTDEETSAGQPAAIQPITNQPTVKGIEGFVRLSGPADQITNELGPLADLVGTWVGNTGWNMIALPQGRGFTLLIKPYIETITFSALGALVPDRQGQDNPTLLIPGLKYDLQISDAQTNQPMHLENGMWLLINPDNENDGYSIARHATVPHGDSVAALGNSSTIEGPPPTFPVIDGRPKPGPKAPDGYTEDWILFKGAFQPWNVLNTLQAVVDAQKIRKTTTITVDTNNSGGIVNIPFVVKNANASRFQCTYWIETVQGSTTDSTFNQLQYFQQTDLNFIPTFGGPEGSLIMWPHVNVNTLVKQ
jgi:hypothetical protein